MRQEPFYFHNDGQLIAGTLHLPDGPGPHPGVIFCHGFTGHKGETHFLFVKASQALASRGIASLRFDFRGSGESEGEFVDMTASAEISDARCALSKLAGVPEVDRKRLGVVGLSLGGLVAACTAGREPNMVKSVVLWSAVAESMLMKRTTADPESARLLRERGWLDVAGLKLGAGFFADVAKLDPVAELAGSQAPVLIVHGTADASVPLSHAEKYHAAVSKPGRRVKYMPLDAVDHTFNRVDWEATVIDATAKWLMETL